MSKVRVGGMRESCRSAHRFTYSSRIQTNKASRLASFLGLHSHQPARLPPLHLPPLHLDARGTPVAPLRRCYAQQSVHVMLLAGGYSADIARGAASVVAAAQPPAGTPRSARITPRPVGAALSAAASAPAAVPALIPLDGTPALVRTLQLLKVRVHWGLQYCMPQNIPDSRKVLMGGAGVHTKRPR